MAQIPLARRRHSEIEQRIHAALEDERAKQSDSTDYVRLSSIGKCARALWAKRQGVPDERPPMGRALMIFRIGDKVEDAVIEWLTKAGYTLLYPPDGDQWTVEMSGGIGVGHLDGIIQWGRASNEDYRLLEVKSAKASKFDELVELDSYAAWNPLYADQLHGYMGASQSGEHDVPMLADSLVVVVCKDDSRIYTEMIRFDAKRYAELEAKAALIQSSAEILPRDPKANGQYSKFCKWCSVAAWCYSPMAGVEFDR